MQTTNDKHGGELVRKVPIDRYLLRISGNIELEGSLNRDNDVLLDMPVAIYDVHYPNNQDGTYNIKYVAKVCGVVNARQGDKVIKAKDKTGNSKKLRGKIYWEGESRNIVDHDGFYDAIIKQLLVDSKYIDEAIGKINLEEYR